MGLGLRGLEFNGTFMITVLTSTTVSIFVTVLINVIISIVTIPGRLLHALGFQRFKIGGEPGQTSGWDLGFGGLGFRSCGLLF